MLAEQFTKILIKKGLYKKTRSNSDLMCVNSTFLKTLKFLNSQKMKLFDAFLQYIK